MGTTGISSSDLLVSLADAIGHFEEGASSTLTSANAGILDTSDFLAERHAHWARTFEQRQRELQACMAYVDESGNPADCSAYVAACEEARRNLETVEMFIRQVEGAVDRYQAAAERFRQVMSDLCPSARSWLTNKAGTVSRYEGGSAMIGGGYVGAGAGAGGPRGTRPAGNSYRNTRGEDFEDVPLNLIEQPSFAPGEWQQADQAQMRASLARLDEIRNAVRIETIDKLIDSDSAANHIYGWFYGSQPVRLDWYQGKYTITNGKHRVAMARALGITHLPARIGP